MFRGGLSVWVFKILQFCIEQLNSLSFQGQLSGVCYRFTYGGCGGNGNNFKSKWECERKCKYWESWKGEGRGVQNPHKIQQIEIFKKQPKIVVMLPQCTPKLFLFIRKVSVTGVIIEPFPYKEIKHSNLLQTGLLVAIPDICQPRRGCKKFQVRGFFSYWTRKGPLWNSVQFYTHNILCLILHTVCITVCNFTLREEELAVPFFSWSVFF